MGRKVVMSPNAGKTGPYSHAVDAGGCLFLSGQTPDDVQKVNVYLTDMDDFEAMNAVYAEQFSEPYPARSTVGVAALVGGAKIEIEMIAKKIRT